MSHAESEVTHERPAAKITHPDCEEAQPNKRHEGEVQKATDQAISDIDTTLATKEKEVMSV